MYTKDAGGEYLQGHGRTTPQAYSKTQERTAVIVMLLDLTIYDNTLHYRPLFGDKDQQSTCKELVGSLRTQQDQEINQKYNLLRQLSLVAKIAGTLHANSNVLLPLNSRDWGVAEGQALLEVALVEPAASSPKMGQKYIGSELWSRKCTGTNA